MAILAAIIDRQFEPHVDDVLVIDQVVAFPAGDHSDRYVVAQFNRDEKLIMLRRYFPVEPGNTKKVSMAGDEFSVYGFDIVGSDDEPLLMLEDQPSMVIPVSVADAVSMTESKKV